MSSPCKMSPFHHQLTPSTQHKSKLTTRLKYKDPASIFLYIKEKRLCSRFHAQSLALELLIIFHWRTKLLT